MQLSESISSSHQYHKDRCSGPPSQKRKFQAVEVHILPTFTPVSLVLFFEGFPLWLVGIEPMWTSMLTIIGFPSSDALLGSLEQQGYPLDVVKLSLSRFNESKILYLQTLPCDLDFDVLLVSGSVEFLVRFFKAQRLSTHCIVGTVNRHYHQRFKHGRPVSIGRTIVPHVEWFRIRHETVGGASDHTTVHGTMNCGSISPHVTTLRRTISYFLNHAIRPTPVVNQDLHSKSFLKSTDRLSPLYWNQPVIFSTPYFASGWGVRPLSIQELSSVFSFPVRLKLGHFPLSTFDVCVPVQSLLALLHPVLLLFHNTQQGSRKRPRRGSLSAVSSVPPTIQGCSSIGEDFRSWLPLIQRWLPHSWIATEVITPGAAKRDDASIPVHLWNQRLQLLYPGVLDHHLNVLRSWLLRITRRNALRSLRHYLTKTYGSDWAVKLSTQRTLQHKGGGGEPSFDHSSGH